MQSGCPQSHRERLYPVLHRGLSNSFTLLQNNNGTAEPVALPAYGDMFATQYPGDLGVGCGLAEWHQGVAQQDVPALHHQLELQTQPQDIVQHPVPMVGGYPLLNTQHQEANGESSSPSHVSPHYMSHVAICTNENSAEQSMVNFGGLQRKYPNTNFAGSNMNIKNRLLHKQNVPLDSSTVALQPVGLNVVSQTSSLHDMPVTVSRKHEESPLLYSCLFERHPETKSNHLGITNVQAGRRSSLSEETKIDSGLSYLAQAKSVLPGLNYAQTRHNSLSKDGIQNSHRSLACNATPSTEHCPDSIPIQQQNSSYLATYQLGKILTDDQILDHIKNRLKQFRASLSQNKQSSGNTVYKKNKDCLSTCMSTMPKPNVVVHPALTDGSDKGELEKLGLSRGAVTGQEHKKDYSNNGKVNAKLLLKAREKEDDTSTPEKHSKEYPQIMLDVAATCTKNEDGSPVVLTVLSGTTLGKLTEKHPNLTLNCSSSQEGHKSDSKPLEYMPAQDNEAATGLRPTDVVGMKNTQDLSEDLQTKSSVVLSKNKTLELILPKESKDENLNKDKKHRGVVIKEEPQIENVIAPSKMNSPSSQIKIIKLLSLSAYPSEGQRNWAKFDTQFEDVTKDTRCVHSQTDRRATLLDDEYEKPAPLSNTSIKSEGLTPSECLKTPKCEDITDDENGPDESVDSRSVTKWHKPNHKGSGLPMCFKDPQYDDISEDDRINVESLLVTPASEADIERSHSPHPGQVQIKTEAISDEVISKVAQRPERQCSTEMCFPYVGNTDDGTKSPLCPKLESKRNFCLHNKHSEDLSNEDDLLFMPVTMSDLNVEPTDLGLNSSKNNVQDDKTGKKNSQDDSPESSVLDDKTGNKQRQHDRSPTYGMEHRFPSKSASASASSHIEVFETIDSFLRAKVEQFRNRCIGHVLNDVMTTHVPSSSEVAPGRSTVANIRNSKVELHTRRDSSSCETDDSCDYLPSLERNYLTASKQVWDKNTLSSKSVLSKTDKAMAEKERDGAATNVKQKQNRIICKLKLGTRPGRREKLQESVVILDSDTDDEDIQNIKKKAKRNRLSSSGSADHPCTPQNRHIETVDSHCGLAKQNPQETSLSSEESPVSMHHSGPNTAQFKVEVEDAYDCTSDCTTNGTSLIEAEAEPPQSNKIRQIISRKEVIVILDSDTESESEQIGKKKAKRRRLSSSESEDIGDAPSTHCPQTVESILSSEESPVPKHQSNIHETNEKLNYEAKAGSEHVQSKCKRQRMPDEPVIAQLTFKVSPQCSDHLKLTKEPKVCRLGQDGMCVSKTTKATKLNSYSSCEQNVPQLHSIEKEPTYVSVQQKTKASDNEDLVTVTKHTSVSRRHSSTEEGPCTSKGSLSSTSRDLHKARKGFPSTGLSQSRETASSSRHHQFKGLPSPKGPLVSSKPQRCNSYSGSSSSEHPPTSMDSPLSSVTKQTAKQHIGNLWDDSYYPTRYDKKSNLATEEDFRVATTHVKNAPEGQKWDSSREARGGPSSRDWGPRQRNNSHDSAAPLMKRSMDLAKRLTKATHRDTARVKTCPVGEGYKWAQKTATASKTAPSTK